MTDSPVAAIVLAAGKGTRMKSALPKVMHPLAGRPLIAWVMETVALLAPARAAVIVAPDMDDVAEAVAPVPALIQERQLGTAHAVLAARSIFGGFDGPVLILYGDTPLLSPVTLRSLLEALDAEPDRAVAALGFRPDEPGGYGRLMVSNDGALEAIVEARDASDAELAVGLCNSGVMAVRGKHLLSLLKDVGNDNAKHEYYLTDIVAIARTRGLRCGFVEAAEEELLGVNSRGDLAAAEAAVQRRLRDAAMAEGATLIDPDTVYFSHDTQLGCDVTVEPNVVFGPGVAIADGAEVRAFCHLQGVEIGPGATVGPFARLRGGATLAADVRIGNFVEVKNAVLEAGVKASHLTYIGDATVGAGANIGAGTITCNYDGFLKSRTEIGAGAFIGSNTALVAPVTVGAGAIVGAGSVITKDVAAEAIAVARGRQSETPGGATEYRARKKAEITGRAAAAEARRADKKGA